ncbi:MAG: hypothetical protein ACRYG7_26575 [Janthinobacterium lividum]
MPSSSFRRLGVQLASLLALAACLATSGCAGHSSLQQKTRWYRHHSSGKAVPCPCGH